MKLTLWLLLACLLVGPAVPSPAAAAPATYDGSWEGRVIRIVDGDTIDVAARIPVGAWLNMTIEVIERIRIARYDAPETHEPRCEAELAAGRAATAALAALAPVGSTVVISEVQRRRDGRGRLVARIAAPSAGDVTDWMIAHGHGRAYSGRVRRAGWC